MIVFKHFRLLYIERMSCHLYHPRIVNLCNVKEVAPSKRPNSKALISLFYLFVSWFHNIWYQSFGFEGFFALNRSSWNIHYKFFDTKFHKLKKKPIWEEIGLNLEFEFQILYCYIFGDMIWGHLGFWNLHNFISTRSSWNFHYNIFLWRLRLWN